ncbi:MFS transporter [Pantoea sp. JGM49]|uniref:MFS transporter n=1 Tax=Pantoea sp. JGM49 TaxID=2799791 RepID=UPI002011FCBD|nr:MFS transporter [Pantoea sp. JGM49]
MGSFSDKRGRKTSLTIIIAGWILACSLCIFIHSVALAWGILIFWGLFRNSPYPVAYALLIEPSPHAAASSLGLMIGLAVGIAGILVAPVSGWIIHTWGFSVHYAVIVGMLLLSCIPLALLKETVNVNK